MLELVGLSMLMLLIFAPLLVLATFLIKEGEWPELVGLSAFTLLLLVTMFLTKGDDVILAEQLKKRTVYLSELLMGILIAWFIIGKYYRILLNFPKLKKLKEKAKNNVPQNSIDAFSIISTRGRGISFSCKIDGIELYDIILNDDKGIPSQIGRVKLSYDKGDMDFFIFFRKQIVCITFLTNQGICKIEFEQGNVHKQVDNKHAF